MEDLFGIGLFHLCIKKEVICQFSGKGYVAFLPQTEDICRFVHR